MTFVELFSADVRIERDIPYRAQPDERHRLDVYSPPNAVDAPVAIYFYGGGWRSGDKRLFEHLGRAMAVRGIVTVTVNYRLTPTVRSPEHARDCAAAVAWTAANIRNYGGDPTRLFLVGHSAGAHLASLIATNPAFLRDAGIDAGAIRGVIPISGVADLTTHVGSTVFTSREFVEEAFGSTEEELAAASPIRYIRPDLPPFLVIVAEDDPPGLRDQGKSFSDALREAGVDVRYLSIKGRDHFSIVRRFGPSDDPTADAIAQFIDHYAR